MRATQPTTCDPGDMDLLKRAQAGSVMAFTHLVDRHYGSIVGYLISQGESPDLAYDLAQETFLDTFRALKTIPTDRPFRAWLFVTARNNLRHHQRQRRVRRATSLNWLLSRNHRTPDQMATSDPADRVVDEETLRTIIDELPDESRDTLYLVGEGHSIKDIASMLEIEYPAARQRVSRAMRYIRDRYDQLGIWPEEPR